MIRKLVNKFWISATVLVLCGCQNLRPEEIALPNYPDLEALYSMQYKALGSSKLEKEISLDGAHEVKAFAMDTSKWKEELAFLKEINPKKPEYVGTYQRVKEGSSERLTLIDGENSILKNLSIEYTAEEYRSIAAVIHEDKDVYVHHRTIDISFEEGRISNWSIEGYQKIMLKDTIWFTISGKVN